MSVAFFTVTCAEDYDYLLGSIEHHAEMGPHLVLDTTPPSRAQRFTNLPDSVIWLHEPDFGSGWRTFRLRSAVERAMRKARAILSDTLVYLDSDEFYSKDSPSKLFPWAREAMVEIGNVHWRTDGHAYTFGDSEWHTRLWPRGADVQISRNTAWLEHHAYNGNPEHHPVPVQPVGLPLIRVYGHFRNHVHYGLGPKAQDDKTAWDTIDGWPHGGLPAPEEPWPPRLLKWKNDGIRPYEHFL